MKKAKIIVTALLSTLLFTACSSDTKTEIVEPETEVSSIEAVDNNDSQKPELDDIDENYEQPETGNIDGNINYGAQYEISDETTNEQENNIDINDIFNDTYWITRTGDIEGEMAMSIHHEGIYGFSVAMGNLSGGRIESLEIKGNTAYISTYFTDGNGNVTIEYVITQNEPRVINVTEKWLKEPAHEYTETYYQISKEEFSNL